MTSARVGHALLGLCLLACSGNKPADSASGKGEPGRSPESPVMTCGPQDSYEYVATRFRCPDGTNPFAGDSSRASQSRLGSSPAPSGNHILDTYEVPCKAGSVKVYVDMYGCPEYANRLEAIEAAGQDESEQQRAAFQKGDFEGVIAGCKAIAADASAEARAWCMALIPASLYALKRNAEALAELTGACSRLPPATADNDVRATELALTFVALATLSQKGKFEASESQRDAMVDSWLSGCQVPAQQLQRTLESMQEE